MSRTEIGGIGTRNERKRNIAKGGMVKRKKERKEDINKIIGIDYFFYVLSLFPLLLENKGDPSRGLSRGEGL